METYAQLFSTTVASFYGVVRAHFPPDPGYITAFGVMLAAVAGWRTYHVVSKGTLRKSWMDSFHSVHDKFWENQEIADVRRWIAADEEYRDLESILSLRVNGGDANVLSPEANRKLEKVDKFCAVLQRIEFFKHANMERNTRILWHYSFSDFWMRKIDSREALRQYIKLYWKGVTLTGFVTGSEQRKWEKKSKRNAKIGLGVEPPAAGSPGVVTLDSAKNGWQKDAAE